MSTTGHGPCPWPYDPVCCDAIPAEADRDEDEQILFDKLLAVATEVLWRASGRRYGLCEYTVRPCDQGCSGGTSQGGYGAPWTPYSDAGVWKNCASGCDASCGSCDCCSAGCRGLVLPGPVHEVTRVQIGSVVLDPASYFVYDHRYLVTSGECWPTCQDFTLPLGQPNTFGVTYTAGIPIGPLGQYALSVYLCELWKLCNGARCALPARVEGVFRQGINLDFADDNLDLLSGMRTGIPQVDTWLALVNPDKIRQASQVYSPDVSRPKVQTWPTAP